MNRSPFPGMDPYLEASWGDIHLSLIAYSRDLIQPQLPDDLRARAEERISVGSPDGGMAVLIPDVRVVEKRRRSRRVDEGGGVAVAEPRAKVANLAKPLLIEYDDDPTTEGFIEIREAGRGGRVVTVIEFLSKTNKLPGKDRRKYLQKRKQLRRGRINLVEIDLLRSGRRMPPLRLNELPPEHRTAYCVLTMRAGQRPLEFFPVSLRAPLPTIPIPLRKTDEDVALDLQAVLQQAYVNGRYDDLDYSMSAIPPLDPADADWTQTLLKAPKSKRSVRE
ncbi:MAG: DUF4058 family protein [Planctomycetaceae bacterium]